MAYVYKLYLEIISYIYVGVVLTWFWGTVIGGIEHCDYYKMGYIFFF
jgi:hypothetical protein